MKKEDLRIVYMGTPDFAVESCLINRQGGDINFSFLQ